MRAQWRQKKTNQQPCCDIGRTGNVAFIRYNYDIVGWLPCITPNAQSVAVPSPSVKTP